ncbi:Esterase/lipase/thioesterase [Tephrocybe sp. NHM501043]|nr:Esterase/lipase/thioesterase [Tephrocybe sp. NHM501043]
MLSQVAALIALSLPSVLAHGGVLSYSNAGNWYWGWSPYNSPDGQTSIQRPWSTYNPITDATDSTIACNDDGTSGALQLTATVAAGSTITAYWNQVWPHNIGPMLTYLAQCPGSTCTGVSASSLKWFKIDQAGLLSGTVYSGSWGSGKMINDNSTWTTTIPKTVPSGNYLIRFETIALHSMPAQFYPECAQIQITGGGSLSPTSAQLVSFPGAYSNSDPGVNIDVYSNAAQTQTTYVIPGPPLYGSSGTTVSNIDTHISTLY